MFDTQKRNPHSFFSRQKRVIKLKHILFLEERVSVEFLLASRHIFLPTSELLAAIEAA